VAEEEVAVTDFAWQFFFNMKMPITALLVVVALMGSVVIQDSRKAMANFEKVSSDYETLEWRIWTSINVIAILGLIWLLIMSVPSPTFKREIVEKPVIRVVERKVPVLRYAKELIVYKTPTYEQAFKLCTDASPSSEEATICHKQATEAAIPPPRLLIRTYQDSYRILFERCMSQRLNGTNELKMIPLCQQYAMRKPIPLSKED
jgi:hypothetical protein